MVEKAKRQHINMDVMAKETLSIMWNSHNCKLVERKSDVFLHKSRQPA